MITKEELATIQREFGDYVDIPASPLQDPQNAMMVHLKLRAKSYIGILGVSPDLTIIINPKIPRANS